MDFPIDRDAMAGDCRHLFCINEASLSGWRTGRTPAVRHIVTLLSHFGCGGPVPQPGQKIKKMEIWKDLASFYGKLLVIALILRLLPANLVTPPEPAYCELGKAQMKAYGHPESAATAHN